MGNLAWEVDNARLEQVFNEHGKVVDARVIYDRESGRSRGFGFVTMASEAEMNDAIAALDGQVSKLLEVSIWTGWAGWVTGLVGFAGFTLTVLTINHFWPLFFYK